MLPSTSVEEVFRYVPLYYLCIGTVPGGSGLFMDTGVEEVFRCVPFYKVMHQYDPGRFRTRYRPIVSRKCSGAFLSIKLCTSTIPDDSGHVTVQ